MPNHASPKKRIRSDQTKKARNRYQAKTCRTMLKRFMAKKKGDAAQELFRELVGRLDKLQKRGIIHKNKSSRLKSRASKHLHLIMEPSVETTQQAVAK